MSEWITIELYGWAAPGRLAARFQHLQSRPDTAAGHAARRYAGILGWGSAHGQAETASGPANATLYAPDDPARQNP